MITLELSNGINGECPDPNFKNHFDIISWSLGSSQAATQQTGSGVAGGVGQMHDMNVTLYLCKGTPTLFEKCATGENIDKATLHCTRQGNKSGELHENMTVEMERVLISSIQLNGSPGDNGIPVHSIGFNFGKVKITHRAVDEKGNPSGQLVAGWDVQQADKVS